MKKLNIASDTDHGRTSQEECPESIELITDLQTDSKKKIEQVLSDTRSVTVRLLDCNRDLYQLYNVFKVHREEIQRSFDSTHDSLYLNLIIGLARSPIPEHHNFALEFIARNFEIVKKFFFEDGANNLLAANALLELVNGRINESALVYPFIEEAFENNMHFEKSIYFLGEAISIRNCDNRFWCLIERYLEKSGLPKKCLVDWVKSNSVSRGRAINWNLRRLYELENHKPGSAKVLYEEFGISCFARYPIEVLLDQVEQKDDLSKPYGIFLVAKEDYEGAFYTNKWLKNFYAKLKAEKINLRVIECSRKFTIGRRMVEFDGKYNSSKQQPENRHKVSFAVIEAHGRPDLMNLDSGHEKHNKDKGKFIFPEDFSKSGVQKVKNFMESDAPIILNSCSTGQIDGIAHKLSSDFNCPVTGPLGDTALANIDIDKTESGKLKLNATYLEGPAMKYPWRGSH